MNFTLHWFRRDFRRHALATGVWIWAVALFTWARLWFRLHPDVSIGDRDLWLAVPALALGLGELFFLLAIMLDDPLCGSRAFWKTRPPAGSAVFGAKVLLFLFISLVVPGIAEAVFLFVAGPSGGTGVRAALYMLPPTLALLMGGSLLNWKSALLWMPVVLVLIAGAVTACLFADFYYPGSARFPDLRLIISTALGTAVLSGLFLWRCRCRHRVPVMAGVLLPILSACAVSFAGWPREPLFHTPPPGVSPENVRVEWKEKSSPYLSRYSDPAVRQAFLVLPLCLSGLPEKQVLRGWLADVTVEISDEKKIALRGLSRDRNWFEYVWREPGEWVQEWAMVLDLEEEKLLRKKSFTLSGTFHLLCYGRKHHVLPLNGEGRMSALTGAWTITPKVEPATFRILYTAEFVEASTTVWRGHAWFDRDSGALVRKSGERERIPMPVSFLARTYLWEGIGRTSGINIIPQTFRRDANRPEWHAVAHPEDWQIECDTVELAGKLEVPFTLPVTAATE